MKILNRPLFVDWFKTLDSKDKVSVRASLGLLQERGPTLPIAESELEEHLKELDNEKSATKRT